MISAVGVVQQTTTNISAGLGGDPSIEKVSWIEKDGFNRSLGFVLRNNLFRKGRFWFHLIRRKFCLDCGVH